MRLSPQTGLPQADDTPVTSRRRRPERTVIGHPAPRSHHGDRPTQTRQSTAAFSAISRSGPLPQQFQAIDPRWTVPTTPKAVLRQAIDTAWQHIPCRVAHVLRPRSASALEIVAAQGERAREYVSCRIHATRSFTQLRAAKPARVKFSGDPARVRYETPDGGVRDEPVRSAITVPIVVRGAHYATLALLDASRDSGGFADGELRALTYLATTVARSLAPMLTGG